MDIQYILEMNKLEEKALIDNCHSFNCCIVVKDGGRESVYFFDDYRIARSISNILDNVKFVSKKTL